MGAIFYILIFVAVAAILYFGIVAIVGDKTSMLEKAQRLVQLGQYDEASEIYNKLILSDQFNPLYHALLADMYFISDNHQRAIVEYEIALKNEKDLIIKEVNAIYRNLGISYFRIKNYPKAFLSLYSSKLGDSNDPEVNLYLGLIYASQRKFDKAMNFLAKSENQDPMNFEIHYYTGIILAQTGKYNPAIKQFTFAKKFQSQNSYLDLYIGALYKQNNDFMAAIRFLKVAAKMIPDVEPRMKAYLLLGECYKGLGLIEDAVTTLEMASQQNADPGDARSMEWKKDVMYHLGMAYVKGGDRQKAMAAWNDLKKVDFFYKDIKELTSEAVSDEALNHVSERWMVMPGVTLQDILPLHEVISRKLFDIDTLEKTVDTKLVDAKQDGGQVSMIEQFKQLNIRKFKEVSRKILMFMGFQIQKEISLAYDSDFQDGKAAAYVCRKNTKPFLVIIKRYNENVSGFILLNAIGTAKGMRIPNIVVIITSRYNQDAMNIAEKNKNLTIIDRRGLIRALKVALN